jgi:hypothetical protein
MKKRDGNNSPPSKKNNLMQDSEGNEENGYPVWDSNKTNISDAKEPNHIPTRTISKKKSYK